jgi:hypothetical protein
MMRSISIEELAGFRGSTSCVFVSIYPHTTQSIYVELVVTERYFQHINPCFFFVAAGAGIKSGKAR